MPHGEEGPLRELEPIWPLILVFIVPLSILAAIFLLVFVYRMWGAIRDGQARTTPGMASVRREDHAVAGTRAVRAALRGRYARTRSGRDPRLGARVRGASHRYGVE